MRDSHWSKLPCRGGAQAGLMLGASSAVGATGQPGKYSSSATVPLGHVEELADPGSCGRCSLRCSAEGAGDRLARRLQCGLGEFFHSAEEMVVERPVGHASASSCARQASPSPCPTPPTTATAISRSTPGRRHREILGVPEDLIVPQIPDLGAEGLAVRDQVPVPGAAACRPAAGGLPAAPLSFRTVPGRGAGPRAGRRGEGGAHAEGRGADQRPRLGQELHRPLRGRARARQEGEGVLAAPTGRAAKRSRHTRADHAVCWPGWCTAGQMMHYFTFHTSRSTRRMVPHGRTGAGRDPGQGCCRRRRAGR